MYKDIMEKGSIKTRKDVSGVLSKIEFAPSCVDMGWEWKVDEIPDYGFLISVTFKRPDTHTGEMGTGCGREWFIRKDSTEKFLVLTAKCAIDFIITHEVMEAFHYRGSRIIDPHKSLEDLAYPNELGHNNIKLQSRDLNKNS